MDLPLQRISMSSLRGKKILLGVSGSIAAYKSVFLVRLLIREGCEVRVIMTGSAKDFVTPLTFSTLSRHEVASDVHLQEEWTNHVEWGLWADAMIIAPATAHTIAKCALGLSSDMLSATYLSARCPVFFAPAMDLDMWQHPATQENISRLQSYGQFIIEVGTGELASGLQGPGRLAEPEDILLRLKEYFHYREDLNGLRVLINAGPTYEAIDPVRYIGNHSTGKMGVAIAEEFAQRGAEVTLVLGPGAVQPANHHIRVHHITTAEDMLAECSRYFPLSDVAVLAAAIADYRPAKVVEDKIKKTEDRLMLELVRTPDIASALGQTKKTGQYLIGFALETRDGIEQARQKMKQKNMDMIVLNNPLDTGAGFGHDTNRVTFLFPDNKEQAFELKTKKAVAHDIVNAIYQMTRPHVKT